MNPFLTVKLFPMCTFTLIPIRSLTAILMLAVILLNGLIEFAVLGSVLQESQGTHSQQTAQPEQQSVEVVVVDLGHSSSRPEPTTKRYPRASCCRIKPAPVETNTSCACADCGSRCPGGESCTCGKKIAQLPPGKYLIPPPCHGRQDGSASPLPSSLEFRFTLDPSPKAFVQVSFVDLLHSPATTDLPFNWISRPQAPPPKRNA